MTTSGAPIRLATSVLLVIGIVSAPRAEQGVVTISGVPHPLTLTHDDLAKMPRKTYRASSATYEGVPIHEILTRAGVPEGEALRGAELAKAVLITGADGYRVVFSPAEFDSAFTDRVSLLADTKDGQPLSGNAAPYQVVIEGEKRPARWVRQVVSIELVPVGGTVHR